MVQFSCFIVLVLLLLTINLIDASCRGLTLRTTVLPTAETGIQKRSKSKVVSTTTTAKRGFEVVDSSAHVSIVAISKPSIWVPLKRSEIAVFTSLSLMMFWIIFIFTVARDTKDALIVTNCGAESIAFLKVYGVVPAAALFMFAYTHLANKVSPSSLFYITVAPFVGFYLLFGFILYPMRNVLHPMSIQVPSGGMSFAVNLLRHWTFSLFYIVSELWGSAGIPLLFWSCANNVVKIEQVLFSVTFMFIFTVRYLFVVL
jgi:ATP/ADP translocase